MKYNVFARPMFKRGGMSQGTGITSGLDTPRRNFQFGTGLAYGQQSFPEGFNRGEEDTSINMQGIPKIYNANFTSEDPSQFRFPFPSEGYFNKMKPERAPPTTISGVPGGGDPGMFYKKPIEDVAEEDIPSLVAEKATKSEEDILLDQLGDTSLSKGEKALMLADIIGTPGGMEGKTKKALELMKGKAKSDRQLKKDIAKLKYLQKGKERIAGISAGALGSTEKTIEAAINARKEGATTVETRKDGVKLYDGKSEAQIRNEIYKLQTAKEDIGEKLGGQILVRSKDEILGLKQKIAELEGKETLSKTEQKQLDKKKKALEFYKKMPGYELLYKEGGRVGYAQGTPMAEPQVAATQTEGANTTENTRPVNKLTFAELRNRLPKEITDDVVQLLAASEEALQDFAYIQTQEDINKFNVKYGVNVILPPQA
jgi:hypothetical protein